MANTRLVIQSTKALAKLVKKALEDLKKSSDKTVASKKNIKNAEKLNTLVEGILDPVAEKDITGSEANKLYKKMLYLDLKLSQDPTLKRKKIKATRAALPETLEEIEEGMLRIADDPELSQDETILNPLRLLLEKKIRDRGKAEFKEDVDLYGGEPNYIDKSEAELLRQPSLRPLIEGAIAKSMENVALPTDEQLVARATLKVNEYVKKNPEILKKFSKEHLVEKYVENHSGRMTEEFIEGMPPTTTNIKNLKWTEVPEIKTFVNQIIKDKPELLNTLTPAEIAAPLLREYKVPRRREGVGYMKFPGATKGQSASSQTVPAGGLMRDPLRDKFIKGQFATSETIPTSDIFDPTYGMRSGEVGPPTSEALQRNVPLGTTRYTSGIAYRPREVLLQPETEGQAIAGIKRYGPPERFRGTKETQEILGRPSRVGTIKGQETKNIPLEGDMPMDVGPLEMRVAEDLLEGLDEKAFARSQAGDAERMGVSPMTVRAIEGERSLSGKPFSMGDRGPMPWTVITPDDVAKLAPEDKILYKRNSDQFFQLIRYFMQEQGMSQRDATTAAKQYMLGEIAESAASARTLMTKTDDFGNTYNTVFDDVGDKVRQERTASMIAPEDERGTTLADSLPDNILDQLNKIDYKKGGKVKAKKKAKPIPKIIKNRNIKGKKKVSKPLGVGAAQRGWGAVRSA